MKLNENEINVLKKDIQELMRKNRFSDNEIERFTALATDALDTYRQMLGDDSEIKCILRKRLGKIILKLSAEGEFSPALRSKSNGYSHGNLLNGIILAQNSTLFYAHTLDSNVVFINSPRIDMSSGFLRNPMVWSVILGLALGFGLLCLPHNVTEFINNDVVRPVLSSLLAMLAGVMGPVVFLSLISAISSLDSINQLSDLGTSVLRRSFRMTIFVSAIALSVASLLLIDFAIGGADFKPSKIVELLLSVVPTNVVSPFLNNNLPQIVILSFAIGAAFLLLGEKTSGLRDCVHQTNAVINVVMEFVIKLTPAVPFLSLLNVILGGNTDFITRSWRYILAVYICNVAILMIKLIKVSLRCKVSIPKLLSKSKDATLISLMSSSIPASMKARFDVVTDKFGVDAAFTELWIPMSQALYYPTSPINLILAPCMVAYYEGTSFTTSLLLIMLILAIQMSIASPGTLTAWTIMLQQLSMPAQYVGVFSTCRILTDNFGAFCVVQYCILENIELAYIKKRVDVDKLRA